MTSRNLILAGASAALAFGAGGVTYAAIPDSDGLIHGCYDNQSGKIRVADRVPVSPSRAETTRRPSRGTARALGTCRPAGPPGPADHRARQGRRVSRVSRDQRVSKDPQDHRGPARPT